MSDLNINNITDRTGGSGPVIAGVSTVSTTGVFTVPVGPTEMRGGRGRAVMGGGWVAPVYVNNLNYITIATTGNASDFGDMTFQSSPPTALGSATRAIFAGGELTGPTDMNEKICYITFSSKGGASTFGELTSDRGYASGLSDSTRGLICGGAQQTPSPYNYTEKIDFITIASTGDASEFGELDKKQGYTGGCSSPTRGLIMGGFNTGYTPSYYNTIQYVTIQTKGNTKDFGSLNHYNRQPASLSNTTRGIAAGGYAHPAYIDTIEYVTIASLGDATDFGNLSSVRGYLGGSASATRGIFSGGYKSGPAVYGNTIEYITIASTGNATDFGDMTWGGAPSACSDSHGGLG